MNKTPGLPAALDLIVMVALISGRGFSTPAQNSNSTGSGTGGSSSGQPDPLAI